MAIRYDVLAGRPKQDGGTFWHRVGTAFEAKDGGMNVYFDSLPLPGSEGKVSVIIRQAKDLREASGTAPRQPARQQQQAPQELDDSIPF